MAALSHKEFQPFSDFLLHDMGSLGDGIVQGSATARQMRTAPLWGVRTRLRLLHDGRATSLDAVLEVTAREAGKTAAFKIFTKAIGASSTVTATLHFSEAELGGTVSLVQHVALTSAAATLDAEGGTVAAMEGGRTLVASRSASGGDGEWARTRRRRCGPIPVWY